MPCVSVSFLNALNDRVLPLKKSGHALLVAIDGVDGAGKTTLADVWAKRLRKAGQHVVRASVDGFHASKTVRYRRGKNDPQGFFEDSYDYRGLRKSLLDPWVNKAPFVTAIFDEKRDQKLELPLQSPVENGILILDGIFLHRPELRHYWDYSIFLKVDFAISVPRGNQRFPGSDLDPEAPSNRRYVEGQKLYIEQCQPELKASLVVDYHNLSQPLIQQRSLLS